MGNKDGRIRKNISIGSQVQIVLKQDQKSGHLTKGMVIEILTSNAKHPHGIKVKIESGKVGRVRKILSTKISPKFIKRLDNKAKHTSDELFPRR